MSLSDFIYAHLVLSRLSHGVQCAAVLEPLNLALVEGVRELDVKSLAAIGGVNGKGHGLANGELSAGQVDAVVGADLVVVGGVREGKREHALLLQVGLVLHLVSFDTNSSEVHHSQYEQTIGQ